MIKFSLPSFYNKFEYIKIFLDYYFEHRDQFYSDRSIESFYDTVDCYVWNGGRYALPEDPVNMKYVLEYFDKHPNIKLRYVFTNCLIDSVLVTDYTCNKFVADFIREHDEVILNHPLLVRHFQEKYPRIPIIYSTTLGLTDISSVNKLTEKNIYVLNYNKNNDNDYLKNLKHKDHIELICAEPCLINCPHRAEHYKQISEIYLHIIPPTEGMTCPYGLETRPFIDDMIQDHSITNTRIKELESMGFQYFKISGRTDSPPKLLDKLLYYLAKPECIERIRQTILLKWW